MDTARQRLIAGARERLQEGNVSYVIRTLPYFCKRTIEFDVRSANETDGYAYLICDKQELTFFDYQVGSRITLGANNSHQATQADTNLSKAKSTNGAADMCVEFIALQPVGARIDYGDYATTSTLWGSSDTDVVAALSGNMNVYDPGAIIMPAQVQSPVNLEQALWSAILGCAAVRLEFDRSGFRPLGSLVQFGQAGGSSYKNAFGEPTREAAFKVEEGYIWARDGQPDSDLAMTLEVYNKCMIPINLITPPDIGSGYTAPEKIWLTIIATLRGFELSGLSENQ
jgi:hypothetical protein